MATYLILLSALLLTGSALYSAPHSGARSPYDLGLYDGYRTPAPTLRGLITTESHEQWNAIGDDGISRGGAQLNSRFDTMRAKAWGPFDPYAPNDAIRIASCILQDNARIFRSFERCIDPSTWKEKRDYLTLASYRQGVGGVLRDGATGWYVERIRKISK